MKKVLNYILFIMILTGFYSCAGGIVHESNIIPIPDYRQPNSYLCFAAPGEMIIDGILTAEEWGNATWSEWFKDIEGEAKPTPAYKTRMKMMWDDNYLYVAAELEDPHVWANLKERDTVIFYDNDFEVFIDPNDDTHAYYELEVNAFETAWDLLLLQPYRDGGPAVDSWDIRGLRVGTEIQGTINDPSDTDQGWTVEIAIPFSSLEECAPGGEAPVTGNQWRINFSRVEWRIEVKDGRYQKVINPETGKPFPENNWVWSPQGYINMHMPEYWGYVQFAGLAEEANNESFLDPTEAETRWILRNLYYRQFKYQNGHGKYANSLKDLSWPVEQLTKRDQEVILEAGKYGYQAYIKSPATDGILVINERGRIVKK